MGIFDTPIANQTMHRLSLILAVYLSALVAAFGQDNPPDPDAPPRALVPLRVAATVTHPDASAWVTPVVLVVKNDSIGFSSVALVTPDAAGQVAVEMALDRATTEAGAAVELEVWHDQAWATVDPSYQFFLDPADGTAAFPGSFKPTWNDALSAYEIVATCSLSPPPLYGEVVVGANHGQAATLVVADFDPHEYRYWAQRYPERLRRPIGTGSVALRLYRWSRVPATRVAILGPKGATVGTAVLRRAGVLPISVKRENLLTMEVDRSVYASTYWLVIVRPEHHEPDPANEQGSAVSYALQTTRTVAKVKCKPGNGDFSFAFYLESGDYVVELWEEYRAPNGHIRERLLTARPIVSTTIDPTVSFD